MASNIATPKARKQITIEEYNTIPSNDSESNNAVADVAPNSCTKPRNLTACSVPVRTPDEKL